MGRDVTPLLIGGPWTDPASTSEPYVAANPVDGAVLATRGLHGGAHEIVIGRITRCELFDRPPMVYQPRSFHRIERRPPDPHTTHPLSALRRHDEHQVEKGRDHDRSVRPGWPAGFPNRAAVGA